MMSFLMLSIFLVIQRLSELVIANRNEAWMKAKGAYEVGEDHYKYLVILHVLFFLSFFSEVYLTNIQSSSLFTMIFIFFVLTQLLRVWVILSLGRYWNTKVLILPNETIIKKGPYKFMRHPNYVVVALELVLIPLLFNAYITALVFTLLNILILSIRIPIEEKALQEGTNYHDLFSNTKRFIPKLEKK